MRIVIPNIRPGTLPGTLVAPPAAGATQTRVLVYSAEGVVERDLRDLLSSQFMVQAHESVWISLVGLQDVDLIKQIGTFFNLHALALEDVLGAHQRPKVDVYEHYEFIVCKVVKFEEVLLRQQLSIFLGTNFVISFLDAPSDLFTMIEKNLFNPLSTLMQRSVDHLAYQLVDFVIDGYFPLLSQYGDTLDHFESLLFKAQTDGFVRNLQRVKSDLRLLKLYVWSHRDLLNIIIRNDQNIIKQEETVYFRDCYDHAIQQIDILESQREMATSLLDIYLSTMANRLNQVIKTLTIISIIFMPPTFLAAVWGMNFKDMPELHWHYGYLAAWAAMLFSSGLACIFFWYYGWLRSK